MKRLIPLVLALGLAGSYPALAENHEAQPVPPAAANPPPPPPDAMTNATWWVSENGVTSAKPYSTAEMAEKIKAKTITADTYVFRVGSAGWVKANADADLQAMLKDQPPPPPKAEAYEKLMVGTWQLDEPPNNGFKVWYVGVYRADGRVFLTQYTQVIDGVAPPTKAEYTGSWKVEAAAKPNEFILQQNFPTGNSSVTFRIIDQNALANTADGKLSYRVQ